MAELITYETIRAAHRAEKEEKLQKLPAGFFSAVRQWIEHKSSRRDNQSMLEIEAAKKILEDLINRREKKIVLSALHTVRGDIPPEGLTTEEQKFFDQIILSLKGFKDDMQQQMWSYDKFVEEKISEVRKIIDEIPRNEKLNESIAQERKNVETELNLAKPEEIIQQQDAQIQTAKGDFKKIKVLIDLPQFVGTDMNYYGPFVNGQTTEIPPEIAGLLSMRGAAEIVS